MPTRPRLTTAEEIAARGAGDAAKAASEKAARSEEDRAKRKERVEKVKDALARSTGLKGDHVVAGRSALKLFLRNLNDAKQPNDDQFEALLEAPFKAPPKPKAFGAPGGFGGGGGRGGPGGPGGRPGGPGGPGGRPGGGARPGPPADGPRR